ncbi:hypothetical protein [Pseudomonas kurunegalensis]|uniref:hypothetical protein n=1 Tax=Pseudomonas kurunegalensis TaxID=485880 RepID=UPI00211998F1|nr:hypothetical protein [Pseudomonas kurunegalensis]
MPTENRSSNTEMVSFPRELSDDLGELIAHRARVCGGGAFEIWEAICEGFGQAVTQPHPEPIAWMVGTAFWWTKEEAERDSVAMGLPIVGLGPMTDTSEIERLVAANTEYARRHLELQGEVERLSRKAANADLALAAQTRQVTTLRAQLAERDALLREVLVGLWPSTPLAIKINAALSASAEPSAPVEIDERTEGCCCPPKGYNGLWAAGPCPVHQGLRKLEQARTALARKPS